MQSKGNLTARQGNPESLPGRGSRIPPSLPPRAHWEDSLVCSQSHCRGHHSAPGLLPSKASSHSLHSDNNPVCWNPQHVCNKALCEKTNKQTSTHPESFGQILGLTQSLPNMHRPDYHVNSEIPESSCPPSAALG